MNEIVSVRSGTFAKCISDMDAMLAKTIKEMLSKGAMDGKVTATVKISLTDTVDDDGCCAFIPSIEYKVSGGIQLKSSTGGTVTAIGDRMAIEWDDEAGAPVMRPMPGAQMEMAC